MEYLSMTGVANFYAVTIVKKLVPLNDDQMTHILNLVY